MWACPTPGGRMTPAMRIGVIGTGHVGLVTCLALAGMDHRVVGTDADSAKVAALLRGTSPFFEPGVEDLLRSETEAGRLTFTHDAQAAVADAEVVFVCVGTPPRADGATDLAAVERVARLIARFATDGVLVVQKSTVPSGTAERMASTIGRDRPGLGFDVAANPEFLREGTALQDALRPDRILVGADSDRAFALLRRVYRPMLDRGVPLVETDVRTAELAKHAANAFLALKVSYANALARVCERAGADVVVIADVMGMDARIGRSFLNAGLGWGGYCFPKDLAAFHRLAADLGYDFPLLQEAARINDEIIRVVADRVEGALWTLEDKRVVLLGLSYKPGTDDVRFSPAIALARELLERRAEVVGYDPHAGPNAVEEEPALRLAADPYEAAADAHCLVVSTGWQDFMDLDLPRLRAIMAYPILVDAQNLFDAERAREAGFSYYPIGRPPMVQPP